MFGLWRGGGIFPYQNILSIPRGIPCLNSYSTPVIRLIHFSAYMRLYQYLPSFLPSSTVAPALQLIPVLLHTMFAGNTGIEKRVYVQALLAIALFTARRKTKPTWKAYWTILEWRGLTYFLKTTSPKDVFKPWNSFTATTIFKDATTPRREFFQYRSVGKPAMLWSRSIAKKSFAGLRKLTRP